LGGFRGRVRALASSEKNLLPVEKTDAGWLLGGFRGRVRALASSEKNLPPVEKTGARELQKKARLKSRTEKLVKLPTKKAPTEREPGNQEPEGNQTNQWNREPQINPNRKERQRGRKLGKEPQSQGQKPN
jgi:hypothetical protein